MNNVNELIQVLHHYKDIGRQVINIEFCINALTGSYSAQKVLDGKNIEPLYKPSRKANTEARRAYLTDKHAEMNKMRSEYRRRTKVGNVK